MNKIDEIGMQEYLGVINSEKIIDLENIYNIQYKPILKDLLSPALSSAQHVRNLYIFEFSKIVEKFFFKLFPQIIQLLKNKFKEIIDCEVEKTEKILENVIKSELNSSFDSDEKFWIVDFKNSNFKKFKFYFEFKHRNKYIFETQKRKIKEYANKIISNLKNSIPKIISY